MKPLRNPLRLSEYVRRKIKGGRQPYYVFIDEIQRSQKILPDDVDLSRIAPEDREDAYVTFYDVLNGLRKIPHVDLYVTGSNSKTLSKDIPTHFRDRGQQIQVRPLSFAEYLPVSGVPNDKAEAFARYLVWGGMPAAVLESDDNDRSRYLKGLFEEVYVKDIRERYGIKDDTALLAVLDVLSSDIGSLTNPHRIGNTMDSLLKLRVSDNTLKSYMDHLEDAFLFAKARRYEVKGRKYIDSPCKYYSTDLGLRNARLPQHLQLLRDRRGEVRLARASRRGGRRRNRRAARSALRLQRRQPLRGPRIRTAALPCAEAAEEEVGRTHDAQGGGGRGDARRAG